MKLNNQSVLVKSLLFFASLFLFSFSPKKGGDSFEIWLNGKKVIQQFVHVSKGTQTLSLANYSGNDKVDIYYNHCGQAGKNRFLTLKDEKDHVLTVWKFADASNNNSAMSFKIKDITKFRKNSGKLVLFYSSSELPAGMALAVIGTNETGIARK